MPKGMQPIYSYTISTAINSFSFVNIPQTYTDLKIVISARASLTSANQGSYIQFNSDGANNYSQTVFRGFGSSIDSYRSSNNNAFLEIDIPNGLSTSNVFSNIEVYIPNYTTSLFKQVIIDNAKENNSASTDVMLQLKSHLYRSNAPIMSITFGTNITAPNYIGGSTFTLYGISR